MERGTRGRPRGKGSRGRGKRGKPRNQIASEENEIETMQQNEQDPVKEEIPESMNNTIETTTTTAKSPQKETAEEENSVSIEAAQEDDISQLELESPSFTMMQRNVPQQVMLRLNWDHKVNLISEKVLSPMIYVCDQCDKPILVYGRMIPCKHVFCLACARTEAASKECPRCKDKVLRVEQTGLGTVYMCTHGGTRYGRAGCRRTYLSQRDLQAHINHRHMPAPPQT